VTNMCTCDRTCVRYVSDDVWRSSTPDPKVEAGRKEVGVKMNLLLLLIAAGAIPVIAKIAGMMLRLLVELIGLVIVVAAIVVLLALATHGKVL
jgi:hypothetical protein